MALSDSDMRVVQRVLLAAADGPFFPDWEFEALFGLERREVRLLAQSWPDAYDTDAQDLAVNNSFSNLLGYPHGQVAAVITSTSVDEADLQSVFDRWREDRQSATRAAD